jgi:hypothetical protein
MTYWTNRPDRCDEAGDDSCDLNRLKRNSHHRQKEFPVRSHTSRTRARMRARSFAIARRKSYPINGAHRRGSGRFFSSAFVAMSFAKLSSVS